MTRTPQAVVASVLLAATRWVSASEATFDEITKAHAEVEKEIKAWVPGKEVPHRLLSWPDGKVEPLEAGARFEPDLYPGASGPILDIKNERLLEEILFDPRAESISLRAAIMRLIDLKGLPWFSGALAKHDPSRWEHRVLRQALDSAYARVSVAQIKGGAMPPDEARRALEDIRGRLDKGATWVAAYSAVADAHPDVERRKREPGSVGVLVGYMYTGWASASGFDFSNLQSVQFVPLSVLAQGIRAGKGGTIVQAPDGLYLVYVFETYSPTTVSDATRRVATRTPE